MRLNKLAALIYRDWLLFWRVKWRSVETFYFPLTTLLIWGFFTLFARDFAVEAGMIILAANIFWSFAHRAQYTVNINMMDDTWTGSFTQLLLSGISEYEYIAARVIFSSIESLAVLGILLFLAVNVFGLVIIMSHLVAIGQMIAITLVGSIGISIMIAAIVLSLGREYGFLTWTSMEVFILLSAPFYSVDVLPGFLQPVAEIMPFTKVFEGVRSLVFSGYVDQALIVQGAITAAAYLIVSLPVFFLIFRHARRSGQLTRMSW
ncbi:MAG: ABC transporter permease [Candidatus Aenigmarchaeota archaeon]|nr:ABC transporter permease [Candidatus Aenigmarchaeota archaeon]